MEEVGFEVTRLTDLDLASDIKGTLTKCLESGIDVFINCPQTVSVWAIQNDYGQTIFEYNRMKERWPSNPSLNTLAADYENSQNKEHNTVAWFPSLVNENTPLLQLNTADIKRLIAFNEIDAVEFQNAYTINIKGEFTLINSISTKLYSYETFISNQSYNYPDQSLDILLDLNSDNFQFVLYDKNKVTIDEFDELLNCQKSINIEVEDCFICSKSANIVTEYTVKNIPENSPYFVPEDCRYSSKLNKLAVLGHRFYIDEPLSRPKNVAIYIKKEFSGSHKEAGAAAFFINPDSEGHMKAEYRGVAQFKYLIEVHKEFYINGKLKQDKNIKKDSNSLPHNSFKKYGYSDENCIYAVKLITPGEKK